MAQPSTTPGRSATSFLVLAIVWAAIFVGSLAIDIAHKGSFHSPWRLVWDFVLTPALCIGNLVGYFKRRPQTK